MDPGVGVGVGGWRGAMVGAGVVPVGGGVDALPGVTTSPGAVVAWEPAGLVVAAALAVGSVVGASDAASPLEGVLDAAAPGVSEGGT
jgi:hypothetical protein